MRRSLSHLLRSTIIIAACVECLVGTALAGSSDEHRYVVVLGQQADVSARVAAERRLHNSVNEVFRSGLGGFVAGLDSADVARLRADPAVLIVRREDASPLAPPALIVDGPVGAIVPNRYLVTLRAGTAPGPFARAHSTVPLVTFTRATTGYAAQIPADELPALANDPRVATIEPDRVVRAAATQNWPSWGLDRSDQHLLPLDGQYVFDFTGVGVTAYIVDTGMLSGHTQFEGRVGPGFTAIADGRGTADCYGHGTHVAGTVGGRDYGLAKSVTLVPVRVLGCTGAGTSTTVVAGMDWIVATHVSGEPAVANLSIGGGFSAAINAAVENAVADGITVVAAAGNGSTDACTTSPSSEPLAITVGATTSTDARSSYSNYGPCLDIFAPGDAIRSAGIGSKTASSFLSGTSMATAHVTGAVVLLLAATPTATPAEILSRLMANATPTVSTDRGVGSPDLLLSTRGDTPTPTVAPGSPQLLAAVAHDHRVELTLDMPVRTGGAGVIDYRIELTKDHESWTVVNDGVSNRLTASATGLTNGVRYTFRAAAVNAVGTGSFSNEIAAMPVAPPANDAFTNATVLAATSGAIGGTTVDATHEASESSSSHGGAGTAASIWYRWTAAVDATLTVFTEGSTFDTVLAVYAGGDSAGLVFVASNDDESAMNGISTSMVAFPVTAGTTYFLAIDGYAGAMGTTTLSLVLTSSQDLDGSVSGPVPAPSTVVPAEPLRNVGPPTTHGRPLRFPAPRLTFVRIVKGRIYLLLPRLAAGSSYWIYRNGHRVLMTRSRRPRVTIGGGVRIVFRARLHAGTRLSSPSNRVVLVGQQFHKLLPA